MLVLLHRKLAEQHSRFIDHRVAFTLCCCMHCRELYGAGAQITQHGCCLIHIWVINIHGVDHHFKLWACLMLLASLFVSRFRLSMAAHCWLVANTVSGIAWWSSFIIIGLTCMACWVNVGHNVGHLRCNPCIIFTLKQPICRFGCHDQAWQAATCTCTSFTLQIT